MSHVPAPSSSAIPATTTVSARFSKPMAPGTPGLTLVDSNGATVAGTRSYDATTRTITFTPSAPLASFVRYTATLAGTDAQGNPIASGGTWSFTTAKPPNPPGVCPCSLFSDETTPTILEINDGVPLSLGTRFTSDVKGVVTGVRFYKSPGNTGAHVGSLWNAERRRAGVRDVHERVGQRVAAAELRHTGRDREEHALRRVLPLPDGALLGHPQRLLRA